jgi:hypothetical protein
MYSFTRTWIASQEAHEEGGQHDEGHRDAVDAELVTDTRAEPILLLDELVARARRIEAAPGHQRQNECDEGGRQRDPADVAARRLVVAAQHQDAERTQDRQGDEAGENAEAEHQRTPPTRYHVMSAAAPSIIAKA